MALILLLLARRRYRRRPAGEQARAGLNLRRQLASFKVPAQVTMSLIFDQDY
jgi:hypothetical protein